MNVFKDFETYSKRFLKIQTKDGELVPLRPNRYQVQLSEAILKSRKENKPVRIIVLKARQIGVSTFCAAAVYHRAATSFHKKSVVVADDEENTTNLFNMCKRYYQFSPEEIRPLKRYSNKKALSFENPDEKSRDEEPGLMSSITLQTSNKLTAGRSGTINYLHLSELAYWANAGTTLTGLIQSVPKNPDSMIFMESTANGIAGRGEEFYLRWKKAEEKGSGYTPLFFPWYDNPEYYELPGTDERLTDEEKYLQKTYKLSLGQLAWRRAKIADDMGNALLKPEEQFCQEYPCSPEEAFIKSGRTVFDGAKILKAIEAAKSYPYETFEL